MLLELLRRLLADCLAKVMLVKTEPGIEGLMPHHPRCEHRTDSQLATWSRLDGVGVWNLQVAMDPSEEVQFVLAGCDSDILLSGVRGVHDEPQGGHCGDRLTPGGCKLAPIDPNPGDSTLDSKDIQVEIATSFAWESFIGHFLL